MPTKQVRFTLPSGRETRPHKPKSHFHATLPTKPKSSTSSRTRRDTPRHIVQDMDRKNWRIRAESSEAKTKLEVQKALKKHKARKHSHHRHGRHTHHHRRLAKNEYDDRQYSDGGDTHDGGDEWSDFPEDQYVSGHEHVLEHQELISELHSKFLAYIRKHSTQSPLAALQSPFGLQVLQSYLSKTQSVRAQHNLYPLSPDICSAFVERVRLWTESCRRMQLAHEGVTGSADARMDEMEECMRMVEISSKTDVEGSSSQLGNSAGARLSRVQAHAHTNTHQSNSHSVQHAHPRFRASYTKIVIHGSGAGSYTVNVGA